MGDIGGTNLEDKRVLNISIPVPRITNSQVSLPRVSDFKQAERRINANSSRNNFVMIPPSPTTTTNDLLWPSLLHHFSSSIDVRDGECLVDSVVVVEPPPSVTDFLSGRSSLDRIEPPIPVPHGSSSSSPDFLSKHRTLNHEEPSMPGLPAAQKNEFSGREWPFEMKAAHNPLKISQEPHPHPLKVVHPRERNYTVSNKSPVSSFAKLALAYFNSKQNVDFEFVELTGVAINYCYPKSTLHINFTAGSIKCGKPELFYTEVDTPTVLEIIEDGIDIKGCSMLMKADVGNPLGAGCGICGRRVIHPGPRDGYVVLMGDRFEESIFWRYGSLGLSRETIQQLTARNIEMYTICASKAIKHLQCEVGDWELGKVLAARDGRREFRNIIHINFTLKSSNATGHKLCFAELSLPLFSGDSRTKWVPEKEAYLQVTGSCILKESDNVSQFGRVCSLCNELLIHPGPKYGYEAAVGDKFEGYDFKLCGVGVF